MRRPTLRADLAIWNARQQAARDAYHEREAALADQCRCGRRKPHGHPVCIRCRIEARQPERTP